MNFFNKNNSITEKLTTRSNNITAVFTKTVSDLSLVNNEVHDKVEDNLSQIEALKNENENLNKIAVKNEKFINKINSFLDDND